MIMPLSGPWAMVPSHQADLWSKDRRKVCRYRLHGGVRQQHLQI